MNNQKANKRVEVAEHCEQMGNTVTCVTDVKVVAGKTSILFTPYWYVKLHRVDKSDVVLFTNPMDWLAYMEQMKPIESWGIGNPKDAYGANNPNFERMQWLTKEVEAGKRFVCGGSTIWADKDNQTGEYRYFSHNGSCGTAYESARRWKTAIKPYLWDWKLEKGMNDEQSA